MTKYLLLTAGIVLILANSIQLQSNIVTPPAGVTGDPSPANTCGRALCHSTTPQTPGAGDVTFNIGTGIPNTALNSNFRYCPDSTYNLAFLLNPAATRYGFEVSASDAAQAQAGTFTLTDTSHTSLGLAYSTHWYVGHHNASNYKNWAFKWTAPAAGTGPITFFYIYNLANGDGTNGGDAIYKSSVTIQECNTGIEDIASKISSLRIFPDPVSDEFGISFDLKEAGKVSSQLYSLDGKMQRELVNENMTGGNFNRSFDIQAVPAGIYLVKLKVGEASVTKKIMKL